MTDGADTGTTVSSRLTGVAMQKGEPMDDTISRQAAIDALAEWQDAAITNRLNNLPSAQSELRWIPCSEWLPEVGQDILMSVGGMYTAEGCLREDGDWAQFRWNAILRKDTVTAWMPLPEHYLIK